MYNITMGMGSAILQLKYMKIYCVLLSCCDCCVDQWHFDEVILLRVSEKDMQGTLPVELSPRMRNRLSGLHKDRLPRSR